MKKILKDTIVRIEIIILIFFLIIIVSCEKKRDHHQNYYNPPPENVSQSKNEYAVNGVVAGIVCSREVNNIINEDTWDSFTSCLDEHFKGMGYEITSKNILKLDGKDN